MACYSIRMQTHKHKLALTIRNSCMHTAIYWLGWNVCQVHLTGVLIHGLIPYVFTSLENIRHDPNLTIECLHRSLLKIEKLSSKPLPKTLFVQADNCVRENKNRYMSTYTSSSISGGNPNLQCPELRDWANVHSYICFVNAMLSIILCHRYILAYFSSLVKRRIFDDVYLSFLPVGHTHADVDQVSVYLSVCVAVLVKADVYVMAQTVIMFDYCDYPMFTDVLSF